MIELMLTDCTPLIRKNEAIATAKNDVKMAATLIA